MEETAQRFQILGSEQLGPLFLDAAAGGDGDRADGLALWGEEDELGTAIGRIWPALKVAGALELGDGLGRRLFAHASQARDLADLNAFRRDKRKDVGVRRADVGEASRAQGIINGPRVVLVEQAEQDGEVGTGRLDLRR